MSSIPNPEEVWMKSSVKKEELERMVEDQVLPAKDLVGWRVTNGELFPTADTEEIVVFTSFFYRGFLLPTSSFFRGLLYSYGIELVNLNPNSILKFLPSFIFVRLFLASAPTSRCSTIFLRSR